MAYGSVLTDVVQSSVTGTPPQFNDGAGTQTGTLCRAWVNYKGTATQSIRASFNVSSVTVNGTGDYTINFTNAMADANYSIIGSAQGLSTNDSTFQINGTFNSTTTSYLTTACRVYVGNSGGALDCTVVNVSVFR
jgi:hypothetical protein